MSNARAYLSAFSGIAARLAPFVQRHPVADVVTAAQPAGNVVTENDTFVERGPAIHTQTALAF